MPIIKVIKGEDGKPYVSLEDIASEMKDMKKSLPENLNNFDTILKILNDVEIEYYNKFIFKKQ